jgi:hypothetical protein
MDLYVTYPLAFSLNSEIEDSFLVIVVVLFLENPEASR